jgi:hypothetical protein
VQLFQIEARRPKEDMTLRIEKAREGQRLVFHVSGRIGSESLDQLKAELESKQKENALDLEHVTLVDVEGVRFLGACEQQGFELVHCSLYIREWINREKASRGEA